MSAFGLHRKSAAFLTIALTVALIGRVSAKTGPLKGDLHVVTIGVNNAKGQQPLLSPAKNAKTQARFWASQAGKLYNRANVAPSLTNEQATREAILNQFDRLIAAVQPGDTAVVYVCAHGGVVGSGPLKDLYVFAAYDGDVRAAELRQRVETLAKKGVRVLLILETCHAGAFQIHSENVIVLSACTAEQTTFEYDVNGERVGVFTQFLVAGLKGAADINHDAIVTLAELNAYVSEQVEKVSAKVSPSCNMGANVPLSLRLATVAAPNNGGTGPSAPQQ